MLILNLSGAPFEESCAQVGTHSEATKWNRHEARAYRAALIAVNGPPPEGYALKIKANPHDFGTYYTVDLHCPTDQALERQDYEAAIEHELAHWRDALMPAPIDYSGNTPTPIDPNNPARRAIVRAIIASRPLSDGRFPTAEIATININLREEFPDLALEADAALSPA